MFEIPTPRCSTKILASDWSELRARMIINLIHLETIKRHSTSSLCRFIFEQKLWFIEFEVVFISNFIGGLILDHFF